MREMPRKNSPERHTLTMTLSLDNLDLTHICSELISSTRAEGSILEVIFAFS